MPALNVEERRAEVRRQRVGPAGGRRSDAAVPSPAAMCAAAAVTWSTGRSARPAMTRPPASANRRPRPEATNRTYRREPSVSCMVFRRSPAMTAPMYAAGT